MKRLIGLTAALFAVLGSSAAAATIHEPADGVSVIQGGSVYFDWAWESDEYATAAIVFTHSADPNDPIWMYGAGQANADPTTRKVISDTYGPYLDSHATILFKGFQAGTWYWRLCNKSIYGEDDKCSYDTGVAPRAITVADGPDCSDGLDNDADGRTDYPSDPGCTGTTDGDETDSPHPSPVPPPTTAPVTVRTLTLAQSHSAVRAKIRATWGSYSAKHVLVWDCTRLASTMIRCDVFFNARRTQYNVRYEVRRSADAITAKRTGRIHRYSRHRVAR